MKYYQTPSNEVFALEEDGSQDGHISPGMVAITIEECAVLLAPIYTDQQLEKNARDKREMLLSQSDWTQLPDISDEVRGTWIIYRQALRDITSQPDFPRKIEWPSRP